MSKSKAKNKNPQPLSPHQSLSSAYYERLHYLNEQLVDEESYDERKFQIEQGDLLLIPMPNFIHSTCDYDLWVSPKDGLYSQKSSIFARMKDEGTTVYRRRIAGIPKLRLYLRSFSGKVIGYNCFGGEGQDLNLLWSMWVEHGYRTAQNRSDIVALRFPLDKWLLNKWIYSWQARG